jgi:N-methylhydantoinase A
VPTSAPTHSLPGTTAAYFGLDETPVDTPVIDRGSLAAGERFDGPAIICEEGATSVIPPRSQAVVLEDLTILVTLD